MSDNFRFTRLNEVSVQELAFALQNVWELGLTPSSGHYDRARALFASIQETRKRQEEEEKALFASIQEAHERRAEKEKEKEKEDEKGPDPLPFDDSQAITFAELDAALAYLGWGAESARSTAYSITSYALAHREPKWQPGDIVVSSARGDVYVMQADNRWKSVADNRFWTFGAPVRPLKKIGVTA